ncbi:hypothetical protein CU019_1886 [Enterococcus faecium]|uniref:hypothetical protein n=1 Tax=Enterococcus TaxID=1350 RepID=UPI00098D5B37|nr:hypothetical protein [Enterococcus faecium]MBC9710849.1 hypothetical protein [Enterococcus sp.]MBK4763851.1 hypothetical protein [Enterococcus faecium]MBK4799085.1 hypothetical protein [Enterococcus faecium]MBK4820472.1 hypothetical protein [Enterococcus faecium]
MTKQVNFRPELKKVTSKSNGNTEVLLVVSNGSLRGSTENLTEFLGSTVTVVIQPETIEYTVPVNKQTKKPNVEYVVNADGTIDMLKEERTSLDVGDGVEEVENVTILVSKETIDEFIKTATTLQLPENITVNIRDVLIRLAEGDSMSEIAADHELSEIALIDQIELARHYFAPYADSWSKHKDDIIFPEEQ